MPFPQIVIVLQPLWEAGKSNNLVSLELVPHVHGKDFGLVRCIEHGRPWVKPSWVHPGDVGPLKFLLHRLQLLVDDHVTQFLL